MGMAGESGRAVHLPAPIYNSILTPFHLFPQNPYQPLSNISPKLPGPRWPPRTHTGLFGYIRSNLNGPGRCRPQPGPWRCSARTQSPARWPGRPLSRWCGAGIDALNPVRPHPQTWLRGLDGGNGCVDVFWDRVPLAEHAAGHVVLAMVRIIFDHLVVWLKASSGDLGPRPLLTGRSSRLRWSGHSGDQWVRGYGPNWSRVHQVYVVGYVFLPVIICFRWKSCPISSQSNSTHPALCF